MTKWLSILVLVLLCTFSAQSQSLEWTSGREYDFGEIEKGKPVETVFQFKNLTEAPIVIELVRSTCGCTVPKWSQTPIGAGEIGEIRVVYDAHKTGYFRKKIKVFFEGKRKGEKLKIFGEVYEYE